jgi:hypothetical protein
MCSSVSVVGFEASTNGTTLSAIGCQLSALSYQLYRYESMTPTSFSPRQLRPKDARNRLSEGFEDREAIPGDIQVRLLNRLQFEEIAQIQHHPSGSSLRRCSLLLKRTLDAFGSSDRTIRLSEISGSLCKYQS